MPDNLKHSAIRGARWGFVENLSSLAVTFIVSLVLQRWFLSPREFGLVGHLAFFVAISISLIDSGFSAAIIRKSNPSKVDLSTTFVTNLLISIVLFAVLQVTAPYIALYFSEPLLVKIIRVLSVILIVNAISIIQRVLLIKAIDFKKLTVCSITSSVLSGIVGIFMAMRGYGVWSLVWQQITRQTVNSIMLWIFGSWKIHIAFSRKSFNELFSYGSNVLITGLLDTVYRNIYFPVIGKAFGTATLGQYSNAEKYGNVTSGNLSQVVQRVSFPVLSKVKDSDDRLKNVFRTILKVVMAVSVLASFCVAALATPLIVGLVGEKWALAAHLLSIVCLAGAFYPSHYLYQNLLQIKGKMRLYLALDIFKKLLLTISIAIGLFYRDIDTLLWGMVVASVITLVVFAYFSGRSIGYSIVAQIKDLLPMFLISFIIALVVGVAAALLIYLSRAAGWWNVTWTNLLAVVVSLILGGGLFLLVYKLYPQKEIAEIKNLISVWKKGAE